jgi:hypothetical protein
MSVDAIRAKSEQDRLDYFANLENFVLFQFVLERPSHDYADRHKQKEHANANNHEDIH